MTCCFNVGWAIITSGTVTFNDFLLSLQVQYLERKETVHILIFTSEIAEKLFCVWPS